MAIHAWNISFLVTALWKYCGVPICTVWKICVALVLMIQQHGPRSIDGSDKCNHIECFCWIRDLGTHFLSHRVWGRWEKMGENVLRSVALEECYFWCWAGADQNLRAEDGGRRKFRGNGCWKLLLYWSQHSFFSVPSSSSFGARTSSRTDWENWEDRNSWKNKDNHRREQTKGLSNFRVRTLKHLACVWLNRTNMVGFFWVFGVEHDVAAG